MSNIVAMAHGRQAVLASLRHHLQLAGTDAEKINILTEAIRPIEALGVAGLLDDASLRKSGITAAEFSAGSSFMRAFVSQMMNLARAHGVEEQVQQALAHHHQAVRHVAAGSREAEAAWGSGAGGAPLAAPTCSNIAAGCTGEAKFVCSRCRLVAYCSAACQQRHYKHHKADCKSPLAAPAFVPAWLREQRRPSFSAENSG